MTSLITTSATFGLTPRCCMMQAVRAFPMINIRVSAILSFLVIAAIVQAQTTYTVEVLPASSRPARQGYPNAGGGLNNHGQVAYQWDIAPTFPSFVWSGGETAVLINRNNEAWSINDLGHVTGSDKSLGPKRA